MNVFNFNSRSVEMQTGCLISFGSFVFEWKEIQIIYILKLPSIPSKQISLTEPSFRNKVVVP